MQFHCIAMLYTLKHYGVPSGSSIFLYKSCIRFFYCFHAKCMFYLDFFVLKAEDSQCSIYASDTEKVRGILTILNRVYFHIWFFRMVRFGTKMIVCFPQKSRKKRVSGRPPPSPSNEFSFLFCLFKLGSVQLLNRSFIYLSTQSHPTGTVQICIRKEIQHLGRPGKSPSSITPRPPRRVHPETSGCTYRMMHMVWRFCFITILVLYYLIGILSMVVTLICCKYSDQNFCTTKRFCTWWKCLFFRARVKVPQSSRLQHHTDQHTRILEGGVRNEKAEILSFGI